MNLPPRANPPTRWIITGGSGFLGTNFLMRSSAEDGEIVVLDRRRPQWKIERPWIRYVEQDVREIEAYRDELVPGAVVIHMASSSYPGTAEKVIESDIQDNILGTVRLAHACADRDVRALLFLSSGGAIYGNQPASPIREDANPNPISAYGVTKLAVEHYLRILHQLRGLPIACLRVANPFGKWHAGTGQGAINVFLNSIIEEHPIELWGGGTQVRDFIPVEDAIHAMRRIGMEFSSGCEAFNIGTGTGRSLNDVLSVLGRVAGRPAQIRTMPARDVDVDSNILDISKMRERFGWSPSTSFEDAVRETHDWLVRERGSM